MKKDTPRTNAVLNTFDGKASKLAADLATHAEELERELTAVTKELAEARAEMIRWMAIAEGRGRTDDEEENDTQAELAEARGQRDRLAEALQNVINEDGTPMSIDRADEALQSIITTKPISK